MKEGEGGVSYEKCSERSCCVFRMHTNLLRKLLLQERLLLLLRLRVPSLRLALSLLLGGPHWERRERVHWRGDIRSDGEGGRGFELTLPAGAVGEGVVGGAVGVVPTHFVDMWLLWGVRDE